MSFWSRLGLMDLSTARELTTELQALRSEYTAMRKEQKEHSEWLREELLGTGTTPLRQQMQAQFERLVSALSSSESTISQQFQSQIESVQSLIRTEQNLMAALNESLEATRLEGNQHTQQLAEAIQRSVKNDLIVQDLLTSMQHNMASILSLLQRNQEILQAVSETCEAQLRHIQTSNSSLTTVLNSQKNTSRQLTDVVQATQQSTEYFNSLQETFSSLWEVTKLVWVDSLLNNMDDLTKPH